MAVFSFGICLFYNMLHLGCLGILVKGIYELWGEGGSFEELEEAIKGYPDEKKVPYLTPESTFRITVDSFGKVISFQEQNERIQRLSYIPFNVRLFSHLYVKGSFSPFFCQNACLAFSWILRSIYDDYESGLSLLLDIVDLAS